MQNIIEASGVATVSVTLKPEITLGVGVPRAGYLRFPVGYPMGEPGDARQQTAILTDLLGILSRADGPGWVEELVHRWRRNEPAETAGDVAALLERAYGHLTELGADLGRCRELLTAEAAQGEGNPGLTRLLRLQCRRVETLLGYVEGEADPLLRDLIDRLHVVREARAGRFN